MVAHVGKADAGWNADHAGARGQQRRFSDAEGPPSGEHPARPIVGRVGEVDVRVIDDAIADGAVKPQGSLALIARAGRYLLGEGDDLRRVAVDEDTRGEVLSHIHGLFRPKAALL